MKISKLGWLLALSCGALLTTSCSEPDDVSMDDNPSAAMLKMSEHPMINGKKDEAPEHKAVVSLYRDLWNIGYVSYSACTGTLIHPQYVLTAAHCVADETNDGPVASSWNKYYKVAVGLDESELDNHKYEIDKIMFHPGYGSYYVKDSTGYYYTLGNDVALVKLKKPIPASEITPIKTLPKWLGITREDVKKGDVEVQFVGYGYDEKGVAGTKLEFKAPLKNYCGAANNDSSDGCKHGTVHVEGCHPSPSMCNDESRADKCTSGYYCVNYNDRVWLSHGTIYYEQDDGGPCQGDSGGPALYTKGGVEYVAGLTSYGDGACAKTGISTATQDFYDWIIEKAPEIADSYVEICDNGVDDDGNGKRDCLDPACSTIPGCEPEICNNKIDDNGNGAIDCDDYMCAQDEACNFGIVVTDKEICGNGVDDNMDGDVDCADAQCASYPACQNQDGDSGNSGSKCQGAPNTPSQAPLGLMLLGLLGAGALLRRRHD